jgi:hypothetical protein
LDIGINELKLGRSLLRQNRFAEAQAHTFAARTIFRNAALP